jgi:hypothetical protein
MPAAATVRPLSTGGLPVAADSARRGVTMRCAIAVGWLLAVPLAALPGCAPLVDAEATDAALAAPHLAPDSVVLEVFFVRFPLGDKPANDLWAQVDEQALDPGVRQALATNGFRAGLVGSQMPVELERLLRLTAEPQAVGPQPFDEAAKTVQRRLQLRAGKRSELVATAARDRVPVLIRENGELRGRTFQDAQTVFSVRSYPEADGRVRLELIPEIQHGQPRQRWRADNETQFIVETAREREPCAWLKLQATISPGEMLVLGCLPAAGGSLGQAFFTEPTGGGTDQKLLVVRLAQTQHDELFAPAPTAETE